MVHHTTQLQQLTHSPFWPSHFYNYIRIIIVSVCLNISVRIQNFFQKFNIRMGNVYLQCIRQDSLSPTELPVCTLRIREWSFQIRGPNAMQSRVPHFTNWSLMVRYVTICLSCLSLLSFWIPTDLHTKEISCAGSQFQSGAQLKRRGNSYPPHNFIDLKYTYLFVSLICPTFLPNGDLKHLTSSSSPPFYPYKPSCEVG